MKRIKFILLLVFLSSPIFIFSNFRPATGKVRTQITAESSLMRVQVQVDKPEGTPVTVRLMDKDNWPLHEQTLPENLTNVRVGINLCTLPNGLYRMEIVGGRTVQTSELMLSSGKNPVSGRQVNVIYTSN